MEKLVDTREIERELRATLSAQREIGPDYDHQLIEGFMRKLTLPMPFGKGFFLHRDAPARALARPGLTISPEA